MKKEDLLVWEKLLNSQDYTLIRSGRWLTKHLSFAIKHLPDKEELICQVFKKCVILLFMLKKSKLFQRKIFCILGYPQGSKWMTFLDSATTCNDQNILSTHLFKILVQELISREKVCRPFWTPAYKKLSEKLWLPIETDCAASGLNSSNTLSPNLVEELQCCKILQVERVSRNLQMTCWPSFMSSLVDKWEDEVTDEKKMLKMLQVRIFPTQKQRNRLDEFIDTSRYVYNKTVAAIKHGHKVNWMALRTLLVTNKSSTNNVTYIAKKSQLQALHEQKKQIQDKNDIATIDDNILLCRKELRDIAKTLPLVKNNGVLDFEINTPKDVRSAAVATVCSAYKSGFSNLKKGNIKFFNIEYKSKKDPEQWMKMTPKNIKVDRNGDIRILPDFIGKDNCIFQTSPRNRRLIQGMEITHDVTLTRRYGVYMLNIPMDVVCKDVLKTFKASSVDLGLRTAASVYSVSKENVIITEYEHPRDELKKLNQKIKRLKKAKARKRRIMKKEQRKSHIVDQFQWTFINHLLEHNDVVFMGDIKSHDIVKKGKIKSINQEFNDMKFFQLKQRLVYKATVLQKTVKFIPEPYTTKTCSSCGHINDVGASKTFNCSKCSLTTGRDVNACKNIFMKAVITL